MLHYTTLKGLGEAYYLHKELIKRASEAKESIAHLCSFGLLSKKENITKNNSNK